MQIVFVGGWGFTQEHYQPFLKGLEERLSEKGCIKYIDNTSRVSFDPPFIGIGHSLGVAYLLKHHAHNLSALINIGGFPCFVKTPQQPYGASPKILRAMQQKFDTQPEQVLHDFYKNCGVETIELLPTAENNRYANSFWTPAYAGDSDGVCTIKSNPLRRQGSSSFLLEEDWYQNLRKGLLMLGDTTFFTPPLCPTLSLHSVEDTIVSVANAKHFGTETILYEGASHALPLTHTTQVIEDIVAFLTRHSCP
jgi:pimeloyl-ACP methyl ester carboxylesterase